MSESLRVLVVTIVHNPQDARIAHRELAALLAAGHQVTYAAAFTGWGVQPPPSVRAVDLPRAAGRRRLAAVRAARSLLRREGPVHDLVLLHDPELLVAAAGLHGPVVVWDVHEDTAAAVTLKPWLPEPLRRPTAAAVRGAERWAERRFRLLLAEDGYVERFADRHPVVPNSTPVPADVPPPGSDRAVYVGHLTRARGALDLVQVGRALAGSGVRLELVGHADAEATRALRAAHDEGDLVWHGFLPNAEALRVVQGAVAGLSLLHDEPNYRHSRPTKVIEYMAHGVPVVTTPTPPARALVEGSGCGVVVPFEDPAAAAEAVRALAADPVRVADLARRGRETALSEHDWNRDAAAFVATLEAWVGEQRPPAGVAGR